MGNIYWSLHLPLASRIASDLGLKLAIESGSYFGSGAVHLATICERVFSIENDPLLHEFCSKCYGNIKNIVWVCGKSDDALARICKKIHEPALFVLDAHWFPMSPRSEFSEGTLCPLMGELDAISKPLKELEESVIMIDDAAMFLDSLDRPFKRSDFPPITAVIEQLRGAMGFAYVEVVDDVIVAGPKAIGNSISWYREWRNRVGSPSCRNG